MNDILWICYPEKMNPHWKCYMCYISEFRQSAVLGNFYFNFYFLNSIESNYLMPFWLLICGDWVTLVWQGQYHGCWCLGSLHSQVVSTHDIDYVEWLATCLPWQKISSTCAITVWGNDRNCKYIFMVLLKNLAHKGLNRTTIERFHWSRVALKLTNISYCQSNLLLTFLLLLV